ncbi:MAG: hypothetical protein FWH59_04145 [Lentimicrobiaceae bacterium]|nr:hypothetical protein [Lentimicrobiaceae bacterium]
MMSRGKYTKKMISESRAYQIAGIIETKSKEWYNRNNALEVMYKYLCS